MEIDRLTIAVIASPTNRIGPKRHRPLPKAWKRKVCLARSGTTRHSNRRWKQLGQLAEVISAVLRITLHNFGQWSLCDTLCQPGQGFLLDRFPVGRVHARRIDPALERFHRLAELFQPLLGERTVLRERSKVDR
uniref:Uncharacterized protein n=1 Tax=Anopheles merus TaxID=30066 RepID=A0A182V6R3_ANOME